MISHPIRGQDSEFGPLVVRWRLSSGLERQQQPAVLVRAYRGRSTDPRMYSDVRHNIMSSLSTTSYNTYLALIPQLCRPRLLQPR